VKIRYSHIIVVGIIALSAFLAYDAFTSYINPYLSVSQVIKNSDEHMNKPIQILGNVANESIIIDDLGDLRFSLTDGEFILIVTFSGIIPQNFAAGQETVVIGTLVSPSDVEASELLVKCPSKYEAEERSFLTEPLFIAAILLGIGAIAYFIISNFTKKKES
jgi:cytochrome c-type biogenesis protein CcmE